MTWKLLYELKSSRNGKINRYKCEISGVEKDILEDNLENIPKRKPKNIDDLWNDIVRSATGQKNNRKPIEIKIRKRDIVNLFNKQNGRCALTGEELIIGINASLDRVDSNKGYILGNIQWIHKDVNLMKGMFSQKRFIEVCNSVEKHNRDSSLSNT